MALGLPPDETATVTYQRGHVSIIIQPFSPHFADNLKDAWALLSLPDQAILLAVAQTIISVERAR